MRKLLASLSVVLAAAAAASGALPEYQEERSTSAVRLSTRELSELLTALEGQLGVGEHGTLTLGTAERQMKVSGDYSESVLKEAPNGSTRLEYSYHALDGPISTVWIRYGVNDADIRVAGRDRGSVVTLANDIEVRLAEHGTVFGARARFILAMIIAILLGLLLSLALVTQRPLLVALSLLLVLGFAFVAFQLGYSGFIFPMIIVRHGDFDINLMLTVIGLALAVLGIVITVFLALKGRVGKHGKPKTSLSIDEKSAD